MMFFAVPHLRFVSAVVSPSKVMTYFGEVRVTKTNIFFLLSNI